MSRRASCPLRIARAVRGSPVVGTLARRLIWQFDSAGKKTAGVPKGGKLVAADDSPLNSPTPRPFRSGASVGRIGGQRPGLAQVPPAARISTQPFKQDHREVYLLTDAERTTRNYSNRFTAHVLRQHIFAALCTRRAVGSTA